MDQMANGMVLSPLFHGRYPQSVVGRLGRFMPRGFEKDLDAMRVPGTYVGINYYRKNRYRYSLFMPFLHAVDHAEPGAPHTAMGDEIYPPGVFNALMRLKKENGNPPTIITENGPPISRSFHPRTAWMTARGSRT